MKQPLEVEISETERRGLADLVDQPGWKDLVNVQNRVEARLFRAMAKEGTTERETDVLRGELKRVAKLKDFRATLLGLKRTG